MYINVHNHTDRSILDAAQTMEDILDWSVEHDIPAVCTTDHGSIWGAPSFYKTCKSQNITYVPGTELYVRMPVLDRALARNKDRSEIIKSKKPYRHCVLLARNNTGYSNLMKILSKAYEDYYYSPNVPWHFILEHAEGLMCTTACLGGLFAKDFIVTKCEPDPNVICQRKEDIVKAIGEAKEAFGDYFFVEIQPHALEQQKLANIWLEQLAKQFGLPLIAASDAHYTNKEDKEIHDIVLRVGKREPYVGNYHLRTEDEIRSEFLEYHSALSPRSIDEAINNTNTVLDFHVDIPIHQDLIPHTGSFEDTMQELKTLVAGGLRELGWMDQEHIEAAKYEIGVIRDQGYPQYMLIAHQICSWATENGIRYSYGRGSVAASVVAAALKLTHSIDPLEHKLDFDRFLHAGRVGPPDIDFDFAKSRRKEVQAYIAERYGEAACIMTYSKFGIRGAISYIGKVKNFDYKDTKNFSELFPSSLDDWEPNEEEVEKFIRSHPEFKEVYRLASKMKNLIRGHGIHPAGVVISSEPISNYFPVHLKEEEYVVQADMDEVELTGMLKFDILASKTADLYQIMEDLVYVSAKDIPFDDQAIYEDMNTGDLTGIFQLEGNTTASVVRKIQPTCFEDVVHINALCRKAILPFLPQYITNKTTNKWPKLHEDVDKILEPTYGVLLFQEQALAILKQLAHYNPQEADEFRKITAKKKPQEMEKAKAKFITSCENNNISQETSERVWTMFEHLAGYAFNKAHAVAYSRSSVAFAYYRLYYPAEFFATLCNMSDTLDDIHKYINAAKKRGIKILPPSINGSVNFESTYTE